MTDTLRSICAQCAHLQKPQLKFIPEALGREKEIILRDLKELVFAALEEHSKTVILLSGGLFESILSSFIRGQVAYISLRRGETFIFDPEHSLDNYVRIFNRYFATIFLIPDIVIDYRNVIHINREVLYPAEFCSSAAGEMLRLLDGLLGKLTEFGADEE